MLGTDLQRMRHEMSLQIDNIAFDSLVEFEQRTKQGGAANRAAPARRPTKQVFAGDGG